MWIQFLITAFRATVIPILRKYVAKTTTLMDDQAIDLLDKLLGDLKFQATAAKAQFAVGFDVPAKEAKEAK